MSLRSRWSTFTSLPPGVPGMLVEAAVALTICRVLVAVGLRWCVGWMLRDQPGLALASPELIRETRFSLVVAGNALPWQTLCLPRAMAGKLMLHRRGCSSSIHLGVGKKHSGNLHAHAWLMAGESIVSGAESIHTVVQLPSRSSQ